MKRLRTFLWIGIILGICSALAACSQPEQQKEPGAATLVPSSTPTAAAMIEPAATASPMPESTAAPVPVTRVSPTSPPVADTPELSSLPTTAATPTSLPSCGQPIVFESQQQRTHSLVMVDACSHETVFLTDDEGQDEWPRWSPDGNYIAFLSNRATNLWDEYRDLWLLNITTHEVLQLTFDAKIWPFSGAFVWSPDGGEILCSIENGNEDEPWVVNLEDGTIRSLPDGLQGPFSWSPDGTKIVMQTHLELPEKPPEGHENDMWFPGNLVVIRPDGSRIAGRSDLNGYRLPNSYEWRWAPDSQRLAVAFTSSLRGGGGDLELVVIAQEELVARARLRDLLPSLEYKDVRDVAWSPNGKEIAFVIVEPPVRDRPYWGQVYVIDQDFTRFRTLTAEGMFCGGVQWSPDGAQLAFACDDGEPHASIWLVDADGSNLHSITEPAQDVRGPQWRPVSRP